MEIEFRSDGTIALTGYVNAVERDSRVLYSPKEGKFVEQVKSGTWRRALSKTNDIKLLFNHDHNRILGSIQNKNLELSEDNIGLKVRCIISDEEVKQKARDNKLTGWSFGFTVVKDSWEKTSNIQRRFLEDINLLEVSILDETPAYYGTSIEQRAECKKEIRVYKDNISIKRSMVKMSKRENLNYQLAMIRERAKKENRAFNNRELEIIEDIQEEIRKIDEEAIEKIKQQQKDKKISNTERRALNDSLAHEIRTALSGASVTVPTEISSDIIKNIQENSGVLNDCKIVNVNGQYKQIKRKIGNSAAWTEELKDISPSNAEYESITLENYKCSSLDILSLEVINQSSFDMINEIQSNMQENLNDVIENTIFNGTGLGQPTGILKGKTLTALTDLTLIKWTDMLVDMSMSLKSVYLNNAKWYLSRTVLAKIKKLLDNDGRFIFDIKDKTLLGYPVKTTEALTDIIVFGDFSKGYVFKMSPGIEIQVLRERYADKGGIGVVSHLFADGKPVDDNAFAINKIEM